MPSRDCTGCGRPEPAYYCWEGRALDCPLRYPPQHLNVVDLWEQVVKLNDRITTLEGEV